MAQPMLNLGGNLSPEQQIEQQQIARQQRMAELLMQQGQQTPQGQMVSGRYVAPNFFQYAAPLLQGYVGRKELEKVEGEQLKLAEELHEQGKLETQRLMNLIGGRPATSEQVTEMAGPFGEGVGQGNTNIPMPVATMAAQPAIEANPRLALAEALNMQSPQARALLPTILERAMPKPNTPTTEIQNYQFMKESGQLPKGMTFLGYQTYLKELGKTTEKAPSGYRFMADGSLEPIKGGPADAKSQAKFAGRENVDTLITGLRDQYNILKSNEGITSTEAGFIPNLRSAASRSAVGQAFGQAVGSTNQSARNTIAQSRPLLLNAIKDATGMSAKQMDSNAELKMYLAAATDPSLDFESNMNALKQLERLFGTPAENQGQGTSKTPTGQQKEVDFNSLPAKPKG
jgi:hypothetical protein